ncbi:MAG: flagellin, partial [Bythopirellula sp.]
VLQLVDSNEGNLRASIAQSGATLAINGGLNYSIHSPDFSITASTGDSFTIDVSGAETVQDVLDLINSDGGNGGLITARLAETGNGIELVDNNVGSLTVTGLEGSQAAEYLGLVIDRDTPNTSAADTLTGSDRNYLENDSVFTTLIRLRDALADNDLPQIERAASKIDADISRATFAQADAGSRLQSLDLTRQNLQDEVIQLQSALSDEIDVDLVQAISELTARQISLEASLRATANILQLSLLNFI